MAAKSHPPDPTEHIAANHPLMVFRAIQERARPTVLKPGGVARNMAAVGYEWTVASHGLRDARGMGCEVRMGCL